MKISFFLSLGAVSASTVSAHSTHWEGFSVTVSPTSLYKPGFSPKPTPTTSSTSRSIPTPSPTTSSTSSTTSSTTSSAASQTPDASLAKTLLDLHNEKRARHQDTPPLVWSDGLTEWAYNYANSLRGTSFDPCSGNLKHSSNRHNQGENIAFATFTTFPALVDLWYNEIKYYDYNNVTGIYHDGKEVGHFTQLVWAASKEVGCAAITCPSDGGYLLCEYSPAGNIYLANPGQTFVLFEENVKPLK